MDIKEFILLTISLVSLIFMIYTVRHIVNLKKRGIINQLQQAILIGITILFPIISFFIVRPYNKDV